MLGIHALLMYERKNQILINLYIKWKLIIAIVICFYKHLNHSDVFKKNSVLPLRYYSLKFKHSFLCL